jgi:HAE1 family hydrophobic/amphiphilic exporter-1
VRAVGRLSEPAEFENIVLKTASDGTTVRLKDVGRAELGAEDYSSELQFNGKDAVGIGLTQLSNANALEVDRAALAELERLSKRFPPGMKYRLAFDATDVVHESIQDVLLTLAGAMFLVVLVIFIFLEDWRSTLIPAAAIPVSLVGTFAFVKLFGFSINTLTLFGITLATGLVVDDAIVVIENIARHIAEGQRDARKAPGGHEGGHGGGHRHLPGAGGRVRARGAVPRHHRDPVPPVRPHHRGLHRDLGLQCLDPDPGALGSAPRP